MSIPSQTIVNRSNAPHYIWSEICDGWRLMDQPGLSVIEERMPPNAEEIRHLHDKAHQLFYVIEGDLTLEVDGVCHRLSSNDALPVLPNQAHQARNEGQQDVRFLVISSPSTRQDRNPA